MLGVAEGAVVKDCDVKDGMVVDWAVEDWIVVGVLVAALSGCEDVEVLVVSGVHSPTTQYALPASRSGQVTPGLMFVKRSTETPQLDARLSQVSPLAAGISK